MLGYAKFLHTNAQGTPLDHSAVHVASQWLSDTAVGYVDIESPARTLVDAVSLTTGFGLSEIWSSLSKRPGQDVHVSNLAWLDAKARNSPSTSQGQSSSHRKRITLLDHTSRIATTYL